MAVSSDRRVTGQALVKRKKKRAAAQKEAAQVFSTEDFSAQVNPLIEQVLGADPSQQAWEQLKSLAQPKTFATSVGRGIDSGTIASRQNYTGIDQARLNEALSRGQVLYGKSRLKDIWGSVRPIGTFAADVAKMAATVAGVGSALDSALLIGADLGSGGGTAAFPSTFPDAAGGSPSVFTDPMSAATDIGGITGSTGMGLGDIATYVDTAAQLAPTLGNLFGGSTPAAQPQQLAPAPLDPVAAATPAVLSSLSNQQLGGGPAQQAFQQQVEGGTGLAGALSVGVDPTKLQNIFG